MFEHQIEQSKCHGGFNDGNGSNDDARVVATAHGKGRFLVCFEVDRLLFLQDGRGRFERKTGDNRESRGDAAFGAAGVV